MKDLIELHRKERESAARRALDNNLPRVFWDEKEAAGAFAHGPMHELGPVDEKRATATGWSHITHIGGAQIPNKFSTLTGVCKIILDTIALTDCNTTYGFGLSGNLHSGFTLDVYRKDWRPAQDSAGEVVQDFPNLSFFSRTVVESLVWEDPKDKAA